MPTRTVSLFQQPRIHSIIVADFLALLSHNSIKSTPPSSASRSNSPIQTHRPLTAAEAFGSGGGRDDYADGAGMRPRAGPGRYGVPGGASGAAAPGAAPGAQPGYAGNMPRRPNNAYGSGGAPPAQGGPEGGRGWRKDLSEVLCFKCNEYGHFANMCPNPAVPGNRGGMERGPGGQARQRDRPRPY